jgi:hypothetical protein
MDAMMRLLLGLVVRRAWLEVRFQIAPVGFVLSRTFRLRFFSVTFL